MIRPTRLDDSFPKAPANSETHYENETMKYPKDGAESSIYLGKLSDLPDLNCSLPLDRSLDSIQVRLEKDGE